MTDSRIAPLALFAPLVRHGRGPLFGVVGVGGHAGKHRPGLVTMVMRQAAINRKSEYCTVAWGTEDHLLLCNSAVL